MSRSSADNEAALRGFIRTARMRAGLFCGAGFALAGRRRAAVVGHVLAWLCIAALLGVAGRPSTAGFRLACTTVVGCVVFALLEWFWLGRIRSLPAETGSFLSRHFGLMVAGAGVCVAAAAILVSANLHALRLGSDAMAPTIRRGELLVYYAGVIESDLRPGRVIAFAPAPESPLAGREPLLVARIVAGPGDKLAIAGDHYQVNGRRGRTACRGGSGEPLVAVPEAPEDLIVPPGRFFVAFDNPLGLDSRTLGWVVRSGVRSSRIFRGGPRGLGELLAD